MRPPEPSVYDSTAHYRRWKLEDTLEPSVLKSERLLSQRRKRTSLKLFKKMCCSYRLTWSPNDMHIKMWLTNLQLASAAFETPACLISNLEAPSHRALSWLLARLVHLDTKPIECYAWRHDNAQGQTSNASRGTQPAATLSMPRLSRITFVP